MKRSVLITILVIGLTIAAVMIVQARSSSSAAYDLSWNTIAGGGGASSNGTYTLLGTIGQPAAGSIGSGNFALSGGFWSGALAEYRIFLPLIVKSS
jgi:hypothetical protein